MIRWLVSVGLCVLLWSAPGWSQTTPRTMARVLATVQVDGPFRVDYNKLTGIVAFDDFDGSFVDIYTSTLTGGNTVCLTCDHATLTSLGYTKHVGNPAWSQDGNWIVFQAQDAADGACTDTEAAPGVGCANDLLIMDKDGITITVLWTTAAAGAGAILHNDISATDTKLLFAERTSRGPDVWRLQVCDIEFVGTPSISGCVSHAPATNDQYYEAHQCLDAACDQLLFTCLCEVAETLYDSDIAMYTVSTMTFTKLTDSNNVWDEHAHQGDDGRILWMSSAGRPSVDPLRADFWIMDANGANKHRLTGFNVPGSSQFAGYNVTCADAAFISRTQFIGAVRLASTQIGNLVTFEISDASRSRAGPTGVRRSR